MEELAAVGTTITRKIEVLENLRDEFSTLAASVGRYEATVPVLCQARMGM